MKSVANICLRMSPAHGKSLNHRMVEAERDLWSLPCPACLLNQFHLEQVAQGHVQVVSEDP